jgi:tRNA A-37 threonylcarbamoyl transferase component Bud32
MRQPPGKSTLPILDELPPGYFVEEAPGGVLALSIDYARQLHGIGFGPEEDGELETSDLHGRNPLFEYDLGDERLVMRRYSHGGLLRWATGARFLDPERPFRELILGDALRRSHISTPLVVAARARPAMGGGWYLDLVTRRVEDSSDFGAVIEAVRRGELSESTRAKAIWALGDLLRRLHSFGLLHADLQPRNLLVRNSALAGEGEDKMKIWVIDLDRSAFVESLSTPERLNNLRRLFRAINRRDIKGGGFLRRVDFVRFFRAYDPDGERWKKDWRRIDSDHGKRGIFHAFGQFFERTFSDSAKRHGESNSNDLS